MFFTQLVENNTTENHFRSLSQLNSPKNRNNHQATGLPHIKQHTLHNAFNSSLGCVLNHNCLYITTISDHFVCIH